MFAELLSHNEEISFSLKPVPAKKLSINIRFPGVGNSSTDLQYQTKNPFRAAQEMLSTDEDSV